MDKEIAELEDRGWRVFGAQVRGRIRGGEAGGDGTWETAYLRLVRSDSPSILKVEPVGNNEGV